MELRRANEVCRAFSLERFAARLCDCVQHQLVTETETAFPFDRDSLSFQPPGGQDLIESMRLARA
jgi:hypothetical protein